jgi:rubrerythrin
MNKPASPAPDMVTSDRAKQNDSARREQMRARRTVRRWYFVCQTCDAKWFHLDQRSTCPRCQAESESRERLVPPWLT